MTTGIAEVFFGALILAVFVFLLIISITFDSVIGTRRPSRKQDGTTDEPSNAIAPKGDAPAAEPERRRRSDAAA